MDISRVGFGTYRINDNDLHLKALDTAFSRAIRTIDTSSNYTNGEAEKSIEKLLKQHPREEIRIISKGGYLQGDNLKHYHDNPTHKEVVFYQEGCFHCIEPHFLESQITQSLERLESGFIDTYLLHNPEYYLLHNIKNKDKKEFHQKEMLKRIQKAFIHLEKEVERGRIKSYGISSNSFAKQSAYVEELVTW